MLLWRMKLKKEKERVERKKRKRLRNTRKRFPDEQVEQGWRNPPNVVYTCIIPDLKTSFGNMAMPRVVEETQVPGIARVKHQLNSCFLVGNGDENNATGIRNGALKCLTNVLGPRSVDPPVLFFLLILHITTGPSKCLFFSHFLTQVSFVFHFRQLIIPNVSPG